MSTSTFDFPRCRHREAPFSANGPASPVATANAADAATDSPAAIEAGIKANDDRAFEESLGAMSPFEVKNLLVKMAKKGKGDHAHPPERRTRQPELDKPCPARRFFLLGTASPWKKRGAPWTSRTTTWPACPPPTEPPRASSPSSTSTAARSLRSSSSAPGTTWTPRAWPAMSSSTVDPAASPGRYPMPDRILRYTQEIVNRYLVKALDDGHARPPTCSPRAARRPCATCSTA